MENKNHNIIVSPDSGNEAPKAHEMATDGKHTDSKEQQKKESREMQRECLEQHYDKLREKEVKCAIVMQEGMKPAIVGTYKNNPFAVYLKIYYEQQEWAAILVTRFKGNDHEMRPPYEVLRNV